MLRSDISAVTSVAKHGAAAAVEHSSLDSSTTGDDKNVSILQLQLFCQVRYLP
jgi:hypothetical protein